MENIDIDLFIDLLKKVGLKHIQIKLVPKDDCPGGKATNIRSGQFKTEQEAEKWAKGNHCGKGCKVIGRWWGGDGNVWEAGQRCCCG